MSENRCWGESLDMKKKPIRRVEKSTERGTSQFVLFTEYYYHDQVEMDEMNGVM